MTHSFPTRRSSDLGKDRFPKQRLCRAGQVSDNSNNLKAGCGGSWRLFNDVGQKVAQAITLIICQLVDRVGKLHYAVNPALCPWIRCATLAALRLHRGWGVVSEVAVERPSDIVAAVRAL